MRLHDHPTALSVAGYLDTRLQTMNTWERGLRLISNGFHGDSCKTPTSEFQQGSWFHGGDQQLRSHPDRHTSLFPGSFLINPTHPSYKEATKGICKEKAKLER